MARSLSTLLALSLLPAVALGGGGFDALGYDLQARIFVGPADGADGVLDGAYFGDPTFARDQLVMKWNAEWDRGVSEAWANPPYQAWIDNQWNGRVPGGSGEAWHYRIVWVGPCGEDGAPLDGGGSCLWGQFSVLLSHGTEGGAHVWDAHALPAGPGAWFAR